MRWFKRKLLVGQGPDVVITMAKSFRSKGIYIPDVDGDGVREPFREKTASGHLDEIKTGQCYRRLQVADAVRALFPNYSGCARCQMPWALVTNHTTMISPGHGMFPLCEDCWHQLGTPANRLPYYREIFNGWTVQGLSSESNWRLVESAVFCEMSPQPAPLQFQSQMN